jgi:hypothetical protein
MHNIHDIKSICSQNVFMSLPHSYACFMCVTFFIVDRVED